MDEEIFIASVTKPTCCRLPKNPIDQECVIVITYKKGRFCVLKAKLKATEETLRPAAQGH